jgi:hypothetical protein
MRTKTFSTALSLLLLFAGVAGAAQFLEVTAEVEVSRKPGTPPAQRHTFVTRCIFGTNTWLIDGNYMGNSRKTWWCTGSNIIERTVATNRSYMMPPDRDHPLGAIIARPHAPSLPPAGLPAANDALDSEYPSVWTNLWRHGPKDFRPLGNDLANVTWLGFCSGPFLKVPGRKILPPLPPKPDRDDTTDKTEIFKDPLGLPKRVEIYTAEKKLICLYDIKESTNYMGWTVPLLSEFTHYDTEYSAPHEARVTATTRVTSLRLATEPRVPKEVMERYTDGH